MTSDPKLPVIAIDIENGQAFGPFETHEQADERIRGYMIELGEWRGTGAEELAGVDLCQAIDEAGWQVMEMGTLEPGDGMGDDIHEQRPISVLGQTEETIADEMISQLSEAAESWHDDHAHVAADGADGRDAHAS